MLRRRKTRLAVFEGTNGASSMNITNESLTGEFEIEFTAAISNGLYLIGSGTTSELNVYASTVQLKIGGVTKTWNADKTIRNSTPFRCLVTRDGSDDVRMFFDGVESSDGAQSHTGTLGVAYVGNRFGSASVFAGHVRYLRINDISGGSSLFYRGTYPSWVDTDNKTSVTVPSGYSFV